MASHERLPMLANSDDEEDETNSGLAEGAENLKIYRSEDQGYKSPMVSTKSVKQHQDIPSTDISFWFFCSENQPSLKYFREF